MSNCKSKNVNLYSEMFKALSNPHRLHIFLYLADYCIPGELSTDEEMRTSVGELAGGLDIAPSTVSHHLKELRQSGLIRMERKGKQIECWVELQTINSIIMFFSEAKGG